MADVRLTVEQIVAGGKAPTNNGSLSTANTYQIRNDGEVMLRVVNGGGSSCNVTAIKTDGTSNTVVAVGAGVTKWIGPFPRTPYNNGDGDLEITLSFITSVTVAVMHLG